jgi:hypothetical protein
MRQKKRRKRRGSRDAECIPSKARSNAAIQSEVSAKSSEKTDETEEEKKM